MLSSLKCSLLGTSAIKNGVDKSAVTRNALKYARNWSYATEVDLVLQSNPFAVIFAIVRMGLLRLGQDLYLRLFRKRQPRH